MKAASEYLPPPLESAHGPVVPLDQAQAAVQAALDDAEHYKYLILRALRRNSPTPSTPQQ